MCLLMQRKLRGQDQRSAKNSCRRKVGELMGSGTRETRKGEQASGQGTVGMKGGFQASVKSFDQTIGVGMKGCDADVCDIEESDEIVPNL
jgi:hypothetical protein